VASDDVWLPIARLISWKFSEVLSACHQRKVSGPTWDGVFNMSASAHVKETSPILHDAQSVSFSGQKIE
jgi:hypothetical protein